MCSRTYPAPLFLYLYRKKDPKVHTSLNGSSLPRPSRRTLASWQPKKLIWMCLSSTCSFAQYCPLSRTCSQDHNEELQRSVCHLGHQGLECQISEIQSGPNIYMYIILSSKHSGKGLKLHFAEINNRRRQSRRCCCHIEMLLLPHDRWPFALDYIIKSFFVRRLALGKGKNEFFVVLWRD